MGWLDDLRKWLGQPRDAAGRRGRPPPPVFTIGPRPFGVGRDVAGVEWQTDKRTSALVRYRAAGVETWSEVVDESRQRDHQRTLAGLTPDTDYQVEVTATVPKRGGGMVTQTIPLRTLSTVAPPVQPSPLEPPLTPAPGEEPIPHPPMTVNILAEQVSPASEHPTQVDPAFVSWLRADLVWRRDDLGAGRLGAGPRPDA